MELLRKIVAALLMVGGATTLLAAVTGLLTGKEVASCLGEIPLAGGFGLFGGWLLWKGEPRQRIGAVMLLSLGAFALVMGWEDLVAGKDRVPDFFVEQARSGMPALVSGWLLWQGRPGRQIGAVWVVSWAASFTIQALTYADEPIAAVVIIARGGVPGFICGRLLWRGAELRELAAVLLVSWPTSYLIYALRGPDRSSAVGELAIGLPTIAVGWLLWREQRQRRGEHVLEPEKHECHL